MKKGIDKKRIVAALMVILLLTIGINSHKKIEVGFRFHGAQGEEGGMNGEMPGNSTLKDLFDVYGQTENFTYELDSEGYVVSINGVENGELGYWAICKEIDGVEDPINDVIGKIKLQDGDIYTVTYYANGTLLEGWQVAPVSRSDLSEPEAQVFAKATEVLLGEEYEAVQVLATQVVSGTNYAYLAQGHLIDTPELNDWFIIKVYEDLEGNVELQSLYQIDVNDVLTTDEDSEDLLGGWQVKSTGKPGTMGSAEAQASFDKAVEELDGFRYNPIQLLATQVVEGTNYKALVSGNVVGDEDHQELYVVTWYEDLEGESMILSVEKLDLLAYVS